MPNAIREIAAASPAYRRGELPFEPAVLTLCVDVRLDSFWWSIRAWSWERDSALVDYGQAASYTEIEQIFLRRYEHGGLYYPVFRALIDSGYNTKKEGGVYDFCARYKEFIPSKGAATNQGLVRPLQETPIEHRGVTLLLKRYSSDLYAEELFHRRIKERVFEKGWWLPRDLCGQYVEHLSNERLEEDKNGKLRWVAKGPNHLAETEKMQCVWFDLLMYAGGEFPKGDEQ